MTISCIQAGPANSCPLRATLGIAIFVFCGFFLVEHVLPDNMERLFRNRNTISVQAQTLDAWVFRQCFERFVVRLGYTTISITLERIVIWRRLGSRGWDAIYCRQLELLAHDGILSLLMDQCSPDQTMKRWRETCREAKSENADVQIL